MKNITRSHEFIKGIWQENPVFVQLLGMCPTLAVTVSAENGLAMGLATGFVLVSSSFIVSLIKKFVPNEVRIAVYTIIIATFVTVAELFLAAHFPAIRKALGPYVPLIIVNCVILGRAEAFASKHPIGRSLLDAIGMGLGFTLALFILGSIREILAFGTFLGIGIFPESYVPSIIMILPPGAFITLGLLVGLFRWLDTRPKRQKKSGCGGCGGACSPQ